MRDAASSRPALSSSKSSFATVARMSTKLASFTRSVSLHSESAASEPPRVKRTAPSCGDGARGSDCTSCVTSSLTQALRSRTPSP